MVVDTPFVNKLNLLILKVSKAWTRLEQKNPKTRHHEYFVVGGERSKLKPGKPRCGASALMLA
ncbi:MAG: hypothetical protein WCA89_03210 [Terracidiphilus sp.]|jgi:hypothetical protein